MNKKLLLSSVIVSFVLIGCAGSSTFVSSQKMKEVVPNSTLESGGPKGPMYFTADGRIISRYDGIGHYKIKDTDILAIDWPSKISPSYEEVSFKLHNIGNGKYLPCWEENINNCDKSVIWKFTHGDIYNLSN